MGKYAERLEGESQQDYERRYCTEKMKQRREKIKAGLIAPPKKRESNEPSKYAVREIGESEQDFRRRYDRIKRRALRAKIYESRTEPPKKRGKNKAPGKNGNLTVEQWESLKIRDGESPEDHKKRYHREVLKLYRSRMSPEKKEKQRIKDREKDNQYRISPQGKEKRRKWYEENTGKINFYSSKRRADEVMATPLWVDYDEIGKIYEAAAILTKSTGVQYHVDHYYPLRGRTVCGLHVHTNLRVITAKENNRKINHHPDY